MTLRQLARTYKELCDWPAAGLAAAEGARVAVQAGWPGLVPGMRLIEERFDLLAGDDEGAGDYWRTPSPRRTRTRTACTAAPLWRSILMHA